MLLLITMAMVLVVGGGSRLWDGAAGDANGVVGMMTLVVMVLSMVAKMMKVW